MQSQKKITFKKIFYLFFGLIYSYILLMTIVKIVFPINLITMILFILFLISYLLHLKSHDFKQFVDKSALVKLIFYFFSCVIGGIMTYGLTKMYSFVNPVYSSAMIGLMGGLIFNFMADRQLGKTLAAAVYCGSFVGMTGNSFYHFYELLAAAVIAGLIFVFSLDILKGFGGKLGSIAFFGVLISTFILNKHNILNESIYLSFKIEYVGYLAISIIAVFINLFLYYKNIILFKNNKYPFYLTAVIISPATTILFCFLLLFIKIFCNHDIFNHLPAIFFGASFVGMASKEVVGNLTFKLIISAGVIFIFIVIPITNVFQSYGGGLGTSACLTVILVQLLKYIKRTPREIKNNY